MDQETLREIRDDLQPVADILNKLNTLLAEE
jgi:hypothetical protein